MWERALEVLNGSSHQNRQQLASDLVDDKYHCGAYLRLTLQPDLSFKNPSALSLIDNFLQTITHAALLDCLSVETYTGTLYNMISGPSGEKAVLFFRNACEGLESTLTDALDDASALKVRKVAELVVNALTELVKREKRDSLHEDMLGLLSQVKQTLNAVQGTNLDRLYTLRRIVELANGLVQEPSNSAPNERSDSGPSLAYRIGLTTPGGRHDNDHMNIAEINIIPTTEELHSDQEEYLPSTDFCQPHPLLDPVQRYLDTHFRLLREDIFGPLKTALSPAITSIPHGNKMMSLPTSDVGLHVYQYASICHLEVHQKLGFEVHVNFEPPKQARKGNREDRRLWWENSKRLEAGILICFMARSAQGTSTLLLVAQKKDAQSDGLPSEHPQHLRMTITARLACLREEDLLMAIRLYSSRVQGTLIEAPGLIPGTFAPVLANLQQATRFADLPFHQYVIPDTRGVAGTNEASLVLPPKYSLRVGFEFDLGPIAVAGSGPITVKPTVSVNDKQLLERLESSTTLDRGQCHALVCALTREFSLIQGPPGTGKSYLGVKLLQVLLSCKQRADLGPIVVM